MKFGAGRTLSAERIAPAGASHARNLQSLAGPKTLYLRPSNWRAAASLLPSVAICQTEPIYRGCQTLPERRDLRPQGPEKNRFFGDFSV